MLLNAARKLSSLYSANLKDRRGNADIVDADDGTYKAVSLANQWLLNVFLTRYE